MSSRKPYYLFKRNRVFYIQFKLPDGTRGTAKSTGETSRARAEQWAVDYLKAGQILKHENVTFDKLAKDFFKWDGPYVLAKRARGLRIGERWCIELQRIIDLKLIPIIGRKRLTEIDEQVVSHIVVEYYKKGFAGSYINKILVALKAILKTAKKQKLIKHVPDMERAANNPKEKGILTIEEVKALLSAPWQDYRSYVASLLAASTGLRLGELQALTFDDIHLEESYIHVWRSWDSKGLKFNSTTKTGRKRSIIIPGNVRDELRRLMDVNPWLHLDLPVRFLFFSNRIANHPMQDRLFSLFFYRALKQIGINDKERRARNITFHSHRHFLNSLLVNAKIPIAKIQAMTGHLTAAMTEHYYHPDDMADVARTVQESIFSASPANGADKIKH